MYKIENRYVFSASDLILQMRSPFASWMARLSLDYPERLAGITKDQDDMMELLAKKGDQHEELYLEKLRDEFGSENIVQIVADKKTAGKATLDAMQSGCKVIVQAYLQRDNFAGYADFLVRVEGKSDLGDYYYEAWDTKLARSTRPYFAIQLACYSWMLASLQGYMPDEGVVVLGNGIKDRFRMAALYSYFKSIKHQFLDLQNNFTSDEATRPDPALESDFGAWASYAKSLLIETDSLSLVAGISKKQIKHLYDANITTLTQLAELNVTDAIKGISSETFGKIQAQAEIQHFSKGQNKPHFKVIVHDNGKGLSSLPGPSSQDVFFDIEGHPLYEGGLEYLWGVSYHDKDAVKGKAHAFKDWWAHDHEQEKKAFEGFIDWVYARWQQEPTMHVYHYASYEITAINKLSTREYTRQQEVTEMLQNGVFIDLYKVVKNGLLIGEPRYSIKNVEHLYREKRTTDVANGGESIVFYENWQEQNGAENWKQQANGYQSWLKDPDNFDWSAWQTLKDIRDYNIDDCESTLELVDWLREQQTISGVSYSPPETLVQKEKTDRQISNQQKREILIARQQALIDRFENDDTLKDDPRAKTLASLLHFYDRERKPQIWSYFERLEKTDDQLLDDDTVVFDITLITSKYDEGKLLCTGTYNKDQAIRTDKISTATLQGGDVKANKITFTELDAHKGEISFEIKADDEVALQQPKLTLFGDESRINTDTLENRLCDITEQYFNDGSLSGVLKTILDRAMPQFSSTESPLPVSRTRYPDDTEYLQAMVKVIASLDKTCLCIQGPPGSGKTYTAKHVIQALVNDGKRVGIMSNSHAAIMNLMKELPQLLPNANLAKVGGYKKKDLFRIDYPEDIYPNLEFRTGMSFTKKAPYENFSVVGATVYGFAKDICYEHPLDYLFVDEASQVALANLVAVTGCAKNIVLMGDQMQLEQPIQGAHPEPADKSALEFMLKGHAVIPEDQGVFLERTYRMHPDVCKPLSEIVYEGKLTSDKKTELQSINIGRPNIDRPNLITKPYGILPITVNHQGNTQSSEEEVLKIQQLIAELKTGTFTNNEGIVSPIRDENILVIAPYNMQVNLLKEKLKGDLKIGTIDKFQGQEAPIVIISMAVSDVAESSRGLDFVFDINRLNVAVSRAQALAIIVANETIDRCNVNSLGQIERVGFFLKLTYKY
jgi:predicted RecB family nuclease